MADFQIHDLPVASPLETDELEAQRTGSGPSIKFSLADLRPLFAAQGSASVLDFGADPSGSADSAGAMNSAISDLPTAGGTVLVPAGTYRIDSSIEILRSDVCLIVEAGARIVASAGFTGMDTSMLVIGDGQLQLSNIVIRGPGSFDGDGSSGASRAVSALGPLNRVVIDGLSIARTVGTKALAVTGMSVASPARNIIIRGNFLDQVHEGIVVREIDDFSIEGNRITDIPAFGQDAIETVNCLNGIISNNVIRNVAAGSNGIELFESAENVVIASNVLLQTEDRNGTGSTPCQAVALLAFDPSDVHSNIQVIGNQIRGSWATGVRALSAFGAVAHSVSILGNTIRLEGTTATSRGINLENDGTVELIQGNVIESCQVGLHFRSTQTGSPPVLINGNVFRGCQATSLSMESSPLGGPRGVLNNRFIALAGGFPARHIVATTPDAALIAGNLFEGTPGTEIVLGFQNLVLGRDNLGLATDDHGTAVIVAGTDVVTISHGLDAPPIPSRVHVTAASNPGNEIGTIWVDNVTATDFVVSVQAAPTSDLLLHWEASAVQ